MLDIVPGAAQAESVENFVDGDEGDSVALIDIRMPKINGFGVLRELRERSSTTKAIMMTAYADIRSAVDSITLGAIDIISKPVDVDEVIMTITRCLNR